MVYLYAAFWIVAAVRTRGPLRFFLAAQSLQAVMSIWDQPSSAEWWANSWMPREVIVLLMLVLASALLIWDCTQSLPERTYVRAGALSLSSMATIQMAPVNEALTMFLSLRICVYAAVTMMLAATILYLWRADELRGARDLITLGAFTLCVTALSAAHYSTDAEWRASRMAYRLFAMACCGSWMIRATGAAVAAVPLFENVASRENPSYRSPRFSVRFGGAWKEPGTGTPP